LLLQKKLSRFLGERYISLHNNGTSALDIAIKAMNLSGEVIVTPFSFPATAHVLSQNNLEPIFCDISYENMVIDHALIERHISNKTSAILGVHVYGNPCNVLEIDKISKKHNLKVIYDGAHSFKTVYNNKPLSSFGDVTMHSFHATKLFNTAEGGSIICRSKKLHEKIESMKNFGFIDQDIKYPGLNTKMNELCALLGLGVLEKYNDEVTERKRVRRFYENHLSDIDGIGINQIPDNVSDSYQYFVIRVDKKKFGKSRDDVFQNLLNKKIFARRYFYPLMSTYPHYKKLSTSNRSNLPVAYKVVNEVLCLPYFGSLTNDELNRIVKAILE